MSPEPTRISVEQALAELPDDLAVPSDGALGQTLARVSRRLAPLGRLSRGWILGTLPVRVAAGYALHWIRGSFASLDGKQRLRNEAHLAAALQVVGSMTYLRGAAMKVGQALANYPALVPDEYIDVLSSLHFRAPPMHFSLLREAVRGDLGADPEQLFAEFDTTAFAAASLGQVHRARLRSGELVAVKIQYPGIARTIQSDFANLSLLANAMRLSRDWDIVKERAEDVRCMVEREVDYRHEARMQILAREALADLPELVVPRVHEQFSNERVLTMDLLEGRHLDAWLEGQPSQAERDLQGGRIFRSTVRLFYRRRFCYADPHPGNYLFLDDGRLGLLDFGSVRLFDDEEWGYCLQMMQAHYRGEEALRRGLAQAVRVDSLDALDPRDRTLLLEMVDWLWEPLRHDGAFDFGSAGYFERGMGILRGLVDRGFVRSMPVNTWTDRLFLGVRALFHRMGTRFEAKAIHDEEARVVPGIDALLDG